MKQIIRLSLIIITGIVAMMCSEGLEEIPNNPPVTGTISDEDRHKVLEECDKFVEQLGDLTSDAAQQVLVEWLKTRPEFEEAGISDKNVWAYFHDGRMAMFIPNWEGAEEEGGRLSMSESSAVNNATPSPAGRTQGVPKTNNVTLFHGLGKAFRDDRQFLKDLFTKSHTTYTVDLKDASIENLKAVKDLGVFYIRTHGGVGLEKPKEDLNGAFGLWTTDTVTLKKDQDYVVDLDWRRLIYCHAVHDVKGKNEWHYGITKEFVHEYMTFAENALQYVDACNSTTSTADEFREYMMNRAGNRKSTYIGWTAPKNQIAGTPTARYIFDRLLGAHDEAVPMEDPHQRPFDVAAIFQDLKSFNLGVSSSGGVISYFTKGFLSKVILTPSIEYIDISDYKSQMSVKGLFGEDPGTVTVDGVAVPLLYWDPELVVCQLPDTGPGSSGDVVVSVRDNKSNTVPLSEWTIPLNISKDELGITTEAVLNLRIRADVHSFRSKPGESPKPPRGDSLALVQENTLGWSFGIGSTGTYSVGGQSRITCPLGDCTISDNKTIITKSGKLPYRRVAEGLSFAAYYKWSMDMKKLYVKLSVNIPDIGIEVESTTVCPGIPSTSVSHSVAAILGIHIPTDQLSKLELTLDDNFTITSGKISKSHAAPPGNCTGTVQFETNAQWSTTVAAFAPNKDTEARHNTGL